MFEYIFESLLPRLLRAKSKTTEKIYEERGDKVQMYSRKRRMSVGVGVTAQ